MRQGESTDEIDNKEVENSSPHKPRIPVSRKKGSTKFLYNERKEDHIKIQCLAI